MLRLSRVVAGCYLAVCLVAFATSTIIGPLGYAPFPLPFGPTRAPIAITVDYGTEKQAWLEEAAALFEAGNPTIDGRPVRVTLEGVGSREMVTEIAQNKRMPTAISPASSVQIELLRAEWKNYSQNQGDIIGAGNVAPQPLVITPLVLVAWEERASRLWQVPPTDLWGDLHGAVSGGKSWKDLGGSEAWGYVKFGHTRPTTSNSGIQTLLLMAYAYHNKTRDLTVGDVTDAGFRAWMGEIEQSVIEFGDSTGTFMKNMVLSGPGKYDMVAVYENLAIQDIENASGRWGKLRVYYPPATILSDHPFAVLNAPWVSAEQQRAALLFRSFLLSAPTQRLALKYGFRPANSDVAVIDSDAANPFNKYRDYGVLVDIGQQVQTPPAETIDTLIETWRHDVNR